MSRTDIPDRNFRLVLMLVTICTSVVIFILTGKAYRLLFESRDFFENAGIYGFQTGIELRTGDLVAITGALIAMAGFSTLISIISSLLICVGSAGFLSTIMSLLFTVASLACLAVAIALTVIVTTHHPSLETSFFTSPYQLIALMNRSPITPNYTDIGLITSYTLMSWFLWIIVMISLGFESTALRRSQSGSPLGSSSRNLRVVHRNEPLDRSEAQMSQHGAAL